MCVMCVCAVWDPCTEHSCISLSFDITYAFIAPMNRSRIEDRACWLHRFPLSSATRNGIHRILSINSQASYNGPSLSSQMDPNG